MGQYWKLMCLDSREIVGFSMGKLGEFLFDGKSPKKLVALLTVPVPRENGVKDNGNAAAEQRTCRLPKELMQKIVNQLSFIDLIGFSKACDYFRDISKELLISGSVETVAPWVGKKLICVGDYLEPGDLPACLENDPHLVTEVIDEEGFERGLYDVAEQYDVIEPIDYLPTSVLDALSSAKCSLEYPTDKRWILCDLSTREYVHADALPLYDEFKKDMFGPFLPFIGFGEVILSRICWSSDPSIASPYEGGMHRGVWAGHRFSITTEDALSDIDAWKDVSGEVVKEIRLIWEADYRDPFWEDQVKNGVKFSFLRPAPGLSELE